MIEMVILAVIYRKGFDKTVWIVVMIILALLFASLWFGGLSEWFNSSGQELMDVSDDWKDIGGE